IPQRPYAEEWATSKLCQSAVILHHSDEQGWGGRDGPDSESGEGSGRMGAANVSARTGGDSSQCDSRSRKPHTGHTDRNHGAGSVGYLSVHLRTPDVPTGHAS